MKLQNRLRLFTAMKLNLFTIFILIFMSQWFDTKATQAGQDDVVIRGMSPHNFSNNATKEKRYALLIGNSHYGSNLRDLVTPANDVQDMKNMLESSGIWEVTTLLDASREGIKKAVTDFSMKYSGKTLLFFYTGHGAQVDNLSYLLPINRQFRTESDIKEDALSVNYVLDTFARAQSKLSIIILDACRDNVSISNALKSIGDKGLAPLHFSSSFKKGNHYIVYATEPDNSALENINGRNSYLTKALVNAIRKYGTQSMEQVVGETKAHVQRETNGKQIPEYLSSPPPPEQPFCILGCPSGSTLTVVEPQSKVVKPTQPVKQPPKLPPTQTMLSCDELIRKVEDGEFFSSSNEKRFFDNNCGINKRK